MLEPQNTPRGCVVLTDSKDGEPVLLRAKRIKAVYTLNAADVEDRDAGTYLDGKLPHRGPFKEPFAEVLRQLVLAFGSQAD